MKANVLLLLPALFISLLTLAQNDTIAPPENYKNVIRWNLTPTLILGSGSWAFGYERVLKPHRSFSVNAGFIQMPKFFNNILDTLKIERHSKRIGFSLAADYRYYFKKRNILPAPDGLYWGPFFTAYYFGTETDIQVFEGGGVKGTLTADSDLLFLMAGVELGYQFTLGKKKRWTLDLIMVGPALRYDIINIKVGADYQGELDDEYLKGIYDALTSIFPGFGQLAKSGEISTAGFASGFGAGFRYVAQVGFRF